MEAAEKKIRELLRESGATLTRVSGNGQEMWKLPTGDIYSCDKPGSRVGFHVWKNGWSRLKKLMPASAARVDAARPPPAPLDMNDQRNYPQPTATLRSRVSEPFNTPRLVREQEEPQEETTMKTTIAVRPAGRNLWTEEQDKVLCEGFDAGMSGDDVASLLEQARPGVTAASCKSRHSYIMLKRAAAKGAEPAPAPAPPVQAQPRPPFQPVYPPAEPDVAEVEVTFKSPRGHVRVNVSRGTAERMMALAVQL